MHYTQQALADMIWDRVNKYDENIHDAVMEVHKEIAARPKELRNWWMALGPFWLKETEREQTRKSPRVQDDIESPIARTGEWDSHNPGAKRPPSRRDKLNPLTVLIAIGTGVRKAYGDMTRDDVMTCYRFHQSNAEAHAHRAQIWFTVHNKMKDGELVRQTAKRDPSILAERPWTGRLPEDDEFEEAA